jgi:hypothetical protein
MHEMVEGLGVSKETEHGALLYEKARGCSHYAKKLTWGPTTLKTSSRSESRSGPSSSSSESELCSDSDESGVLHRL